MGATDRKHSGGRPVSHPALVALLGSARVWSGFDSVMLMLAAASLVVAAIGWIVIGDSERQISALDAACSGGRCTQQLIATAVDRRAIPGGGAYSISSRTDVCDLTARAPRGVYSARFPGAACAGLSPGSSISALVYRGQWLQVRGTTRTWNALDHPADGVGAGLLLQLALVGTVIFGGILRVDLRTRWPPLRRFL